MHVEIQPDVHRIAAQLGADVPYALKAVAGQLADDPDLGRPSGLPGILTVTVDGTMFEDCPDLSVGYLREPDRVEVRYLEEAAAEPSTDVHDQEQADDRAQGQPVDPVTTAITARQIADAWRRITAWLQANAPDSCAALRTGAGPAAIAAVEDELGIRIPVELHVLWLLTAGDDGSRGRGCLPHNRALMTLEAVMRVHRMKTQAQAHQDILDTRRPEDERIIGWKPTWVPVIASSAVDDASGLYLDTESGHLGQWSRYNEAPDDVLDTLVTYLEKVADMLEAPALATWDKPGLLGGTLVWHSSVTAAEEDRWQPWTG